MRPSAQQQPQQQRGTALGFGRALCAFLLATGAHAFLAPAGSSSSPLSKHIGGGASSRLQRLSTAAASPAARRGGALSMITPQELWQGYLGLIDTHPLITKSVTSGIIVPLGDLSAQAIEQAKARKAIVAAGRDPDAELEGIDWGRVLRFAIFGGTLQGPWNHFYFQWFDNLIPPPANPNDWVNVKKVLLDQFIQAPIFTVVIFTYLDILEGKNWEGIKAQIKRDFVRVITTNWWVWIPFTAINYVYIPPSLRVLYVNCAFLAWCVFLSLVINQKDGLGPDKELSKTP